MIEQYQAMPQFRKQLRVWRQEHRTRYKEWRAWWDKRREHVERALRPKTADDKALTWSMWGDPPHPGWKPSWQDLPIPDHRTPSGWAVIDTTRADWQELAKPVAEPIISIKDDGCVLFLVEIPGERLQEGWV